MYGLALLLPPRGCSGWGAWGQGAINHQEGESRANKPQIPEKCQFCHLLCCNPKYAEEVMS